MLNLGCGIRPAKGFINVDKFLDINDLKKAEGKYKNASVPPGATYVQGDMCELPFKDNYADYVETVDAIEHIEFRLAPKAFSEMYRVLKKGGMLALMTPNFDALARAWVNTITDRPLNLETYFNLMEIVYGNQSNVGEFHKTPYTPFFLGHMLEQAGFKKIKMSLFPAGCSDIPPYKAHKWPEGAVMRNEMIWIEAIK